jgi:rhodanese-related sulfurtransferase
VAAGSPEEAERAVRGLRSIALLDVAGFVVGGGPEKLEPIHVEGLDDALAAGAAVIDVRERDEFETGSIPGARNVPYRLMGSVDGSPDGHPLITICESGARAVVAASVLRSRGIEARPVAGAGVPDWLELAAAR